ncbi:MAG: beta-lactamase family protein, partial [Thermoleophilia bacterium]|nr:beta-lactamase family protein [Thermoleophilia bacterium]
MRTAISLAAVLLALPPAAGAAVPASCRADLDGALAAGVRAGLPGVQAAVVTDGRVVWRGARGLAVRRPARPVTDRTLFALASASKPYTAAMVLRLAEQGRLGIDDPARRFVRTGGAADARVTVRHLLGHTSGLPDVYGTAAIGPLLEPPRYDPRRTWRLDPLLHAIPRPATAPGTAFSYSNSNYLALGRVVAVGGGEPISGVFRRLITAPLSLRDTHMARRADLMPRTAHGYAADGRRLRDIAPDGVMPTDLWNPVFADGGLVATASDVARFYDRLVDGPLLGPATRRAMLTPVPGSGGEYGLGLELAPGWAGHTGEWTGFTASVEVDREAGVSVAALTNTDREGVGA